jgi:hypothetical protein
VPGAGRWATALLLDGNAGIGGDPEALLGRLGTLVRPGGRILIEVEEPGVAGGHLQARIETAARSSSWFPWARVGVDDLEHLGAACRLTVGDVWQRRGRWFGMLEKAAGRSAKKTVSDTENFANLCREDQRRRGPRPVSEVAP